MAFIITSDEYFFTDITLGEVVHPLFIVGQVHLGSHVSRATT